MRYEALIKKKWSRANVLPVEKVQKKRQNK